MGGGKLGIDFLPGLLGTAVFSKIFRYLSYLTHISLPFFHFFRYRNLRSREMELRLRVIFVVLQAERRNENYFTKLRYENYFTRL